MLCLPTFPWVSIEYAILLGLLLQFFHVMSICVVDHLQHFSGS